MEQIEWHDVQGLVLSGYPKLPHAAYVLWRFHDNDGADATRRAKEWLQDLTGRLMRAGSFADDATAEAPARPVSLKAMKAMGDDAPPAINLALTASGLSGLGVTEAELAWFSPEFREGMAPRPTRGDAPTRRANILGDLGRNAPDQWGWGGWHTDRVDGVLMIYARTPEALDSLVEQEIAHMAPVAAPVTDSAGGRQILRARIWDDLTEHFGFRDGVSQPIIEGTGKAEDMNQRAPREARVSVVKPGEFLLGYPNERGTRISFPEGPAARDLSRNGTYLVFRQLEQNVEVFRKEVARAAAHLHGSDEQDKRDWVAARMIGRRQNGEPLIPASADSVVVGNQRNDFLYHFEDRFGLRCPLGSHVRRANPRDIIGPTPDSALRLSKMHRIIRRGRPYGEKLPADAYESGGDGSNEARGMLFIALNADIAGQFELIQHTWLNNGRFAGLYDETDPLAPGEKRAMTIQRRPASLLVEGMEQFVTMKGGAYFYLPGIRTLQTLAH